MKKNLGSTIALVLGVLSIISGLAKPNSVFTAGIIIIIGALAYRSAKKRKLGEAPDSILRKSLEVLSLLIILALVLLQNNVVYYIVTDPFPNLIIPLWAITAYLIITLKKQKNISTTT